MSDFIEFVADHANDQAVGNEFIQKLNSGTEKVALQEWFRKKGYDITLQECQELISKKDNIVPLENNLKY